MSQVSEGAEHPLNYLLSGMVWLCFEKPAAGDSPETPDTVAFIRSCRPDGSFDLTVFYSLDVANWSNMTPFERRIRSLTVEEFQEMESDGRILIATPRPHSPNQAIPPQH